MNDRHRLLAWLGDALAMETELLPILRDHAQDAAGFPELRARIEEHIGETEQHAERMRQAIGILGGSSSTLKSAFAAFMGGLMAPGTSFFSDALVKNGLMDYATEHFEIAAYTALMAAANDIGEEEIARLCGENLEDEVRMAEWLMDQLPETVRATLGTRAE